MRIAVDPSDPPARRALRLLLGERQLQTLGVWKSGPGPSDPRVRVVDDLDGFDVYVVGADAHPRRSSEIALAAGASCVLAADGKKAVDTADDLDQDFQDAGLTLLLGANLRSAVLPALAAQESALTEEVLEVTAAWTVAGRPRRRGEPLPFPDPIGSLWGVADDGAPWPDGMVASRRFAAPVEGPWAGVVAKVAGIANDGVITRVVGVADDAEHLAGIALAAAAATVAAGHFHSGATWIPAASTPFLDRALDGGLEVAAFTIRQGADERS